MPLSTIFDGVTAVAAVAVAVIANRYAKRQTTLQALRDLESRLADLDDRYIALGDLPTVMDAEAYAMIESNTLAISLIQQRLNALESFSLAVIEHVIDPSIAKRLAGHFALDEYNNLKWYIEHIHSSEKTPDPWREFETLAKSWSGALVA